MKNIVILKITGKNIEKFIKRLNENNINIYKIKTIHNDIFININYKDIEKLDKIKTIYKYEIVDYIGINKYKKNINKNKYLILSLILGIILFTYLLNTIFEIEIIHNNVEIRTLIKNELEKYGLTKYSIKKSYDYIEEVEKNIINNNKDKIEWLEIECIGIKYVIKIEERIINKEEIDNNIYDIVSNKDAIVKKIIASSGEVIVTNNQYVKKGDILISQDITLNGEVKDIKSAKGKVYGEVWYNLKIEYPLDYYEEKLTGNMNNTYVLKILEKNIELNKKYENKKTKDKIILKNNILPIQLVYQNQLEYIKINDKLTKEEAYDKALIKARDKIQNNLDIDEYIIYEKCLKNTLNNSKIEIEMFYAVYEDITLYQLR